MSVDADRQQSDYDLVGGGPAISQVVERFYQLVLGDPLLAPLFTGVDVARLKRHQVLLVSQVMGGPADYDGRELHEAHAGLGITDEHFDHVVEHLVASLQEAGVPDDVIGRVGGALAGTRGDVVGTSAPAGADGPSGGSGAGSSAGSSTGSSDTAASGDDGAPGRAG